LPVVCWCGRGRRFNSSRAHQMDPDQDIYCSKEPWVVHGSQPPATSRHGGRTAVQERFTGLTSRGVDKPAAPPPNRSSATPQPAPVNRCSAPMPPGGQRRRGGGEAGALQRLDLRLLVPHSTIACADGSRDNPTTSRTLVSSSGSVENPEGLGLPGLPSCSAHTRRDRAVADSQLVGQQPT
jgi:hypothetical protein